LAASLRISSSVLPVRCAMIASRGLASPNTFCGSFSGAQHRAGLRGGGAKGRLRGPTLAPRAACLSASALRAATSSRGLRFSLGRPEASGASADMVADQLQSQLGGNRSMAPWMLSIGLSWTHVHPRRQRCRSTVAPV
jgi:hypothetical protein